MRCESPSTFLGTCLSHHSFIIFLVTNTNTLLSGLYLISTFRERIYIKGIFVSMPSRAYTSFLQQNRICKSDARVKGCQCPLGLIPHFYGTRKVPYCDMGQQVSMPSRAYTSFLPGKTLISIITGLKGVNALSGLYLISTYYQERKGSGRHQVSMPSRAYTSFLRYPFKNLGFMRFPEPVFADIYQNILTTAVFRAC